MGVREISVLNHYEGLSSACLLFYWAELPALRLKDGENHSLLEKQIQAPTFNSTWTS